MGGCVQLGQHRDRCRGIVSIRLLVDRAWFWRLVDHFFCHCMFHFAVMGGYFPETNKDGVVRELIGIVFQSKGVGTLMQVMVLSIN